jgi:leucyl-tRNA synthetase
MIVDADNKLQSSIVDIPMSIEQERLLHQTIKKVTNDIEGLDFNTAISQLMVFVNEFLTLEIKPRFAMEQFVLLLSPFAPHLSEELWEKLGHTRTIAYEPWPRYDESKLQEDTHELVVQINGKVRSKFVVPVNVSEDRIKEMVLSDQNVRRYLDGKQIVKIVVVKNKLVSLVVK